MRPISGATLYLSNLSCISVEFVGDIQVTAELLIKDLLFVPSFRFNLLSVSALMKSSSVSVQFADSYCLLQDRSSLRTIGKVSISFLLE